MKKKLDDIKLLLDNSNLENELVERKEINLDEEEVTRTSLVTKIPRARDLVEIAISERNLDLDLVHKSNFQEYRFIKDLQAIWSLKENCIECELQQLGRFPSIFVKRRLNKLFEIEPEEDENIVYEFPSPKEGISISIGKASLAHAVLFYTKDRGPSFDFRLSRYTLKITGTNTSKHDEAKSILEKLGNSLLFQLDLSSNLNLQLSPDREFIRSLHIRSFNEFDGTINAPSYEYDKEAMSLYWYAKSAIGMPLLQFLALYQILEFYFPIFSEKDAQQKIKNIIKDPRFNPNKDTEISKVISVIKSSRTNKGFGSELDQLKATLDNCIDSNDLKSFIDSDAERKQFFEAKKSRSLSKKRINFENPQLDLVSEIAERIYEIRCRIVHTKSNEGDYELLLPSSPQLKFIEHDITALEYLATKVIISTSRSLTI
jgi:hypothetical protein